MPGREWIDFMNLGVDKGAGVAHLCEHLDIDIADAAAVGDTYNDIPMLERVGHSFIVDNAEEHMNAHAKWRIPSNNDGGVLTLSTPSWRLVNVACRTWPGGMG